MASTPTVHIDRTAVAAIVDAVPDAIIEGRLWARRRGRPLQENLADVLRDLTGGNGRVTINPPGSVLSPALCDTSLATLVTIREKPLSRVVFRNSVDSVTLTDRSSPRRSAWIYTIPNHRAGGGPLDVRPLQVPWRDHIRRKEFSVFFGRDVIYPQMAEEARKQFDWHYNEPIFSRVIGLPMPNNEGFAALYWAILYELDDLLCAWDAKANYCGFDGCVRVVEECCSHLMKSYGERRPG